MTTAKDVSLMDMSLYLLIGLLLGALLSLRVHTMFLILLYAYWLVIALWSVQLIDPFHFTAINWVPSFDIKFDYHIDGLARVFSLLISGIGLIVFAYTMIYTQREPQKRRKLYSLLQIFAVSMLGIVITDNMLVLYLFWELTTISSYLLIQFKFTDSEANQAGFNALFVCVLGSLGLLISFILLYNIHHSWSVSENLRQSLQDQSQLIPIFLCFMLGVITKSAQFPFYFWLNGAMRAPTPVSAYLHSATMVNAGIYLLARFHPLFSQMTDWWYPVLSTFGLITMLISSILSLFQEDLKAILAYTTVFALGAMIYLLGGNTMLTIKAFVIFLLFHGVYKAGLFMLVGTIDKTYHTRQLANLRGIARGHYGLAIIALITFGSMAGLPPFFGFTVKEMILEAKLAGPTLSIFFMTISLISSMCIAASSFRCLWYFFSTNQNNLKLKKQYTPLRYGISCSAILSGIILLFSAFDQQIDYLVRPSQNAVLPNIEIFYTTPNTLISVLLSILTVLGGLCILLLYIVFRHKHIQIPNYLRLKSLFEYGLQFILFLGKKLTNITQGANLSSQLRLVCISNIVIMLLIWHASHTQVVFPNQLSLTIQDILVYLFLIIAALSIVVVKKFTHNLVSLSIIGLAITFFFATNGAVDVAITQFFIEILTVIILLISLSNTKIDNQTETKPKRIINILIGIVTGAMCSIILLGLRAVPKDKSIQHFFINNSLDAAYGKNVVNVILVDFRSFDTLGESLVIVATAIGIAAILRKYFGYR